MNDFRTGDMVLIRHIDVWYPKMYVGIGTDGNIYFSDGYSTKPDSIEMVLLTEDTIKLMGSNCKSQKGWEPQQGELVAVKNDIDSDWRAMVFIEKYGEMYRCEICDNSEEEDTYWDQCEPLHKHFMFRSKEKCEVQDDFR